MPQPTDTRLAAALLRSSINGMADRYADARGDWQMYLTAAAAYPSNSPNPRVDVAKRAMDRRRKALSRLTAALTHLATKGA